MSVKINTLLRIRFQFSDSGFGFQPVSWSQSVTSAQHLVLVLATAPKELEGTQPIILALQRDGLHTKPKVHELGCVLIQQPALLVAMGGHWRGHWRPFGDTGSWPAS